MSHTNELDNGVAIIANGGDLSGDVTFILPDGRRMETTWDRMFALEVENVAMRGAISVALQVLGLRPHPAHIDVLQAAKSIRETVAALSPPTGKVLVYRETLVRLHYWISCAHWASEPQSSERGDLIRYLGGLLLKED